MLGKAFPLNQTQSKCYTMIPLNSLSFKMLLTNPTS